MTKAHMRKVLGVEVPSGVKIHLVFAQAAEHLVQIYSTQTVLLRTGLVVLVDQLTRDVSVALNSHLAQCVQMVLFEDGQVAEVSDVYVSSLTEHTLHVPRGHMFEVRWRLVEKTIAEEGKTRILETDMDFVAVRYLRLHVLKVKIACEALAPEVFAVLQSYCQKCASSLVGISDQM